MHTLPSPDIEQYLLRIATALEAIAARPEQAKARRRTAAVAHKRLLDDAREGFSDPLPVDYITTQWSVRFPSHPQPLALTSQRKQQLRSLWHRFDSISEADGGHKAGIDGLFDRIEANAWLCGKPCGQRGITRGRGPVNLFEVVEHAVEIFEGTYQ